MKKLSKLVAFVRENPREVKEIIYLGAGIVLGGALIWNSCSKIADELSCMKHIFEFKFVDLPKPNLERGHFLTLWRNEEAVHATILETPIDALGSIGAELLEGVEDITEDMLADIDIVFRKK